MQDARCKKMKTQDMYHKMVLFYKGFQLINVQEDAIKFKNTRLKTDEER